MSYNPTYWSCGDAADRMADSLSDKIEKLVDESVRDALINFLEDGSSGVALIMDASSLNVRAVHLELCVNSPGEDLIKLIDEALETAEEHPEYPAGPLGAMKKAYLDWIEANPSWKRGERARRVS